MSRMKRVAEEAANRRGGRAPARSASEDGRTHLSALIGNAFPGAPREAAETVRTVNTDQPAASMGAPLSERMELCLSENGTVKMVMVRVPVAAHIAILDFVRFTIGEETLKEGVGVQAVSDEELMLQLSPILHRIFGYGISDELKNGRDFFARAWELGDNYGHVAVGGARQAQKILVSVSGQGLLNAADGWEHRLYQFLTTEARRPALTRVDVTHDEFDGLFTVDDANKWWQDGELARYGNTPEPYLYGPWLNGDPRRKGRTFRWGCARSSQIGYAYEKGKQLGCPESPWVRFELRFSNHDRVIPFEILLDPSSYFVSAYPALSRFKQIEQPKKTQIKEKAAQATEKHLLRYTKISYGKVLKLFRQVYGDKELLDMVESDSDEWPKRLHQFDPSRIKKPIHLRENYIPVSDIESASSYIGRVDDPGYSDSTHYH